MKKGVFVIAIIAMIGSLLIASGVLIAAVTPPDEVVIENEGYKRDRYGPTNFSHKKHSTEYGAACTDCHHEYEDGKNVWKEGDPVEGCAECHDPNGKRKDEPMGLRYAYHENCEDCHEKALKEGKKDAPRKTQCTVCHKRKR
jgi:hypothetical protein